MSKKSDDEYWERVRRSQRRYEDEKPWFADDIRQKLEALGIDPEQLVDYLDWVKTKPR
jgi:hypothetical protein